MFKSLIAKFMAKTLLSKIIIVTSTVVVIGGATSGAIIISKQLGKNNNNETIQNEQHDKNDESLENSSRFKNTIDLKNFSSTLKLKSGKQIDATGLDMIFDIALKVKTSTIKTANGGTLYSRIITAVGPGEIKAFIINDDVIGGYIIYYNYEDRNYPYGGVGTPMKGYYIYTQAFAIKVTDWNGLNNLRNITI